MRAVWLILDLLVDFVLTGLSSLFVGMPTQQPTHCISECCAGECGPEP